MKPKAPWVDVKDCAGRAGAIGLGMWAIFFFFFFLVLPWHVDIPGPGTEPKPGSDHAGSSLGHQGTPSGPFSFILKFSALMGHF